MVRSTIEIFILGTNFYSSCFSVAVIKYYDQEQHKKERIYFGVWHQRISSVLVGMEGLAAVRENMGQEQEADWSHFHPYTVNREKRTGSRTQVENHKAYSSWHTSSRKTLPPTSSLTSPAAAATGDQVFKCINL